jgi:Undecaprenyl-phosphate glucose phosphotransferase
MTIESASSAPPAETLPYRSASWLWPALVVRLVMLGDGLLIVGSGIGCEVGYNFLTQSTPARTDAYAAVSLLVAFNFCLLIMVQRGYELKSITNLRRRLGMTLATWAGVFAALLAISFVMKVSDAFSRGTTISFYLVGLAMLLTWDAYALRWTSRALRAGAFANSRVVVIAERGLWASSSAMAELSRHGYRVIRVLEIDPNELASPLMKPRLDDLIVFARENSVEHVLLLMNWSRQREIDVILDRLRILPIPVRLVPDANVARFLKYPRIDDGDTWTAELRRAPLSWEERAAKRVLDVVGSLLAFLLLGPIMLLAAVAVKCTSAGPVFFRQTRNGFNGRAFRILKFRTMRVLEDGPTIVQATRNDPRVTAVGKWLRKTSIDELPQLFNVLKGEMSLIGPRPHAAAHNSEYERIIGNYAFRHHVKPGISGWAQINGCRGETGTVELMQKRVELDLWYINNYNLWLDIRIILRTLYISAWTTNAY